MPTIRCLSGQRQFLGARASKAAIFPRAHGADRCGQSIAPDGQGIVDSCIAGKVGRPLSSRGPRVIEYFSLSRYGAP